MKIDKSDLLASASKLGISEESAEELWDALSEKTVADHPRFELSHLLYYFGAMIVILALGWFAGLAWTHFEGKGLLAIALLYMLVFIAAGSILWHEKDLKVPGGLFITMAVCLIPLAVFGLQKWTGLWIPVENTSEFLDLFYWMKGGNFLMQAATIMGGCIALNYFRFPFLTAPIFFAAWLMLLDVVHVISKKNTMGVNDNLEAWVSVVYGICILIAGYITDMTARKDFAFWGYLFGVLAFWWGLTQLMFNSTLEDSITFYLLTNIFLVFLAMILQRTVFLVFGALGILVYLINIYGRYFSGSVLFPVILSLIGLLIVFAGILYHKNRQKIDAFVHDLIPKSLHRWLPKPNRHHKS